MTTEADNIELCPLCGGDITPTPPEGAKDASVVDVRSALIDGAWLCNELVKAWNTAAELPIEQHAKKFAELYADNVFGRVCEIGNACEAALKLPPPASDAHVAPGCRLFSDASQFKGEGAKDARATWIAEDMLDEYEAAARAAGRGGVFFAETKCREVRSRIDAFIASVLSVPAAGAGNDMRDALAELADLMDDVVAGEYTPDKFTTRPARAALSRPSTGDPETL